jgi:hypothetical protein
MGEEYNMSQSMLGTLRLLGIIAVVLLGSLALLVVLDILPRDLLQTWVVKLLLVIGILALVALVVALLVRRGSGD